VAARGALNRRRRPEGGGQRAEGRVFLNAEEPGRGPFDSSARWPALLGFIGLTLLVAVAGGAITAPATRTWYLLLARPPGTPPNWVFGPVWTALYLMMAVAAWLVWQLPGGRRALRLWGWQLAVNAAWAPLFFGLHHLGAALADAMLLAGLAALTARRFAVISRPAGTLMLPYVLWACYACYLTAGFWWLNAT
jgi:translocator protein